MGLFSTLGDRFAAKEIALDRLPGFLMGAESKTGIHVTYATAVRVATIMAGLRVLAEGVAQVPLQLKKTRNPGPGSDPAFDHPLYPLLYRCPNGWQTAFEFREHQIMIAALCGNWFGYKSRGAGGRILEILPLEVGAVSVTRNNDLTLTYRYTPIDGVPMVIPTQDMWHIRGPSLNSWMGIETVRIAREALGLSLALEESHALLHKNGAQASGVYSVEGKLTDPQHADLTKWIKQHTAGPNKHNPLILDMGAKWLEQSMTGVDSEHLATRRFQIEEACRFLRLFPQMVGHAGDQTPTFASAEAFFTAHVMHSLAPWCERIEHSADVNLLTPEELAAGYFIRHDLRGLMRGALKDQGMYFSQALGAGGSPPWMTQDEVRDETNLNPMGGTAATLREPSNVGKPVDKPGEPDAVPPKTRI